MKHLSKIAFIIASSWLCTNTFAAVPNTDDPRTFVGPTLRLSTTNAVADNTAYSLAGEAGYHNFRIGGTVGWNLTAQQHFKVSAEYLWQRINYAFFSGDANRWVRQAALGAAYRYDFLAYSYRPQFDLNVYYAHAGNSNLSTVTGTYIDSTGTTIAFTDNRRIAGATSAGISPGFAFRPWHSGRFSVALNYDNVRYDTRSGSVNEDAKGLGGTLGFNQTLAPDLGLGLSAGFRKPYNHYAATLWWNYLPWYFGLFGNYTTGKNTLPSTFDAGLSINYMLDQRPAPQLVNMKGEILNPVACNNRVIAWTSDPAVYMPQVIAIA